MTKARAETSTGRRKLSDEHRARLSAASRKHWDGMTPDQKAAALARIGRKPAAGAPAPPAKPDPPPAIPPAGGRVNPLAMTPRELVRHLRGDTNG